MATSAMVPQANGHVSSSTLPKQALDYEKIVKLRDDVFAGNHPRLKLTKQVSEHRVAQKTVPASVPAVPSFPLLQQINGFPHYPAASQPRQTNGVATSTKISKPSLPAKPPTADPPSKPTFTTSSIDPVLLTKSDVLVKAEYRQKRQRIERALEEQILQRRLVERAASDQDVPADFDVGEVLEKAHELVKPFKPTFISNEHAAESPSDSFDENTFYSSQMNDTTSEEVDRSPQRRTKGSELEQHNRRQQSPNRISGRVGTPTHKDSTQRTQGRAVEASNPDSRIAALEEELKRLKAEKEAKTSTFPQVTTLDEGPNDEDVPYSPPDVQMPLSAASVGHDVGFDRNAYAQEPRQTRAREYHQRDHYEPSLLPDNMRIVRSHITSPLAPQPSRVSPLAVAKEPRVYQDRQQGRRNSGQNETRIVDTEVVESERQRPTWQDRGPASGSRKRRRGPDSTDRARNVHARRDTVSPEVRIKEEPASPPPNMRFADTRYEDRWREQRPLHVETDRPPHSGFERTVYLPPRDARQGAGFSGRTTPNSPGVQRIATNGVSRYQQEPDLRRVVSTRQLRHPSPVDALYQPRPVSSRVISQPAPTHNMDPLMNPRASLQPRIFPDYDHVRTNSPALVPPEHPPRETESAAMAPPPRRIVVDQFGNRFWEAVDPYHPAETARASDDHGMRYRRPIVPPVERRDAVLMPPAPPHERAASPIVPRYEYPAPRTMQVLDRATGRIVDEREYPPREARTQSVAYEAPAIRERYTELSGPQEVVRMQSVRPVGTPYDGPYNRSTRVQSLHPEQERFVREPEVVGPISRHASVRPEAMVTRSGAYTMEDRPRYQFPEEVEERRYSRGGHQRRYVYMDDQDRP